LQKVNAQRATVGLPPWSQLPSPENAQPELLVDKPPRRWLKPGLVAVGILLAYAIGAAGGGETPVPAAMPAPTVTVTEPAPPAGVVERTPQSCLDALDYADEGFGLAAKVIGYMEPAIQAVLTMDAAKMNQITHKIDAVNKKMDKVGPAYRDAADECQESK